MSSQYAIQNDAIPTMPYSDVTESVWMLTEVAVGDSLLMELLEARMVFDPFAFYDPDRFDEDELLHAIGVVRDCFPAIYADVVGVMREGGTDEYVDQVIVNGINNYGIPGVEIEFADSMWGGIPVSPWGFDYLESHYEGLHPTLKTVIGWFIGDEGKLEDMFHIEADYLIRSLWQQPHPIYNRTARLLQWIFHCTGNWFLDVSWTDWAENDGYYDGLGWTPEDIEFAFEQADQADSYFEETQHALRDIESNVFLRALLKHNIKRMMNDAETTFHWTEFIDRGFKPPTAHDARLLRTRGHHEQTRWQWSTNLAHGQPGRHRQSTGKKAVHHHRLDARV